MSADQFTEVDLPSYGEVITYIQTRFNKTVRIPICQALNNNDYANKSVTEFNRISGVIRRETEQNI